MGSARLERLMRIALGVSLIACGGDDPIEERQTLRRTLPVVALEPGQELNEWCQTWALGNDAPLYIDRIHVAADQHWHHSNWYAVRADRLSLYGYPKPKRWSKPGESEAEFRGSLRHVLREQRDLQVEKLRKRYAPKLARLEERIRTAEARVGKEQEQVKQQKLQTMVSMGASTQSKCSGSGKQSDAAR